MSLSGVIDAVLFSMVDSGYERSVWVYTHMSMFHFEACKGRLAKERQHPIIAQNGKNAHTSEGSTLL